jgi:excisionase family DNA binding protein
MPKPAPTPIADRPGDAARVLGVSRATIYKMMTDGKLKARHLGGATLIAHEELVHVFQSAPLTPHTRFARAAGK